MLAAAPAHGLSALCVTLLFTACALPDTAVYPSEPSRSIGNPVNTGSANPLTIAVIGDTPYGPDKLAELPDLIDLINGDPKVDLVVHLGDIKAGKNDPCHRQLFRRRARFVRRLQGSSRLHAW